MPTVARVLWLFPRRRRMTRLLAWAAIACASCAEPLPSPTRSSAAAPEGAVPLLSVRVDGDSAATAIVQVSEVTFDASGTRGDKLRYAIDFGDGEAAATPVASHVYRREGTFMATLRVTDAAGRESVISAPVVVRALQGAWFQAGLNAEARRFEVHRLAVTAQEGAEVRGVYSYWGEVDRSFTGRLASGRHLSLAVDGGAVRFEGTVPAEMAAGGFPLTLLVQGGSASGQTLRFDPVPPDPPRAPPQARLHVTSGVPGISEFIYEGLEATFDASGSTGDGLTYFMELGDGATAREAVVRHALLEAPTTNPYRGAMRARAIVVDRFGRVDAATQSFAARNVLIFGTGAGYLNSFMNARVGRWESRALAVSSQRGTHVAGSYQHPEGWKTPFTGTLTGANRIRIVLDDGTIEFTGTLEKTSRIFDLASFVLAVRGGSADGATLEFHPYAY